MKKKVKWQQKYKQQLSVVFAVVAVGLLVGGVVLAKGNPHNSGGIGQVYFNPSSGSYPVGSTIALAVHENSGTTGVYSEQVGFSYPQNLLQFDSIDGSGSGFALDTGLSTGGSGHVTIIRGSTSPLMNDQLIADVNFTVLANGSGLLSFDPLCQTENTSNCTTVYNVNTANVIGSMLSASFKLGSKH